MPGFHPYFTTLLAVVTLASCSPELPPPKPQSEALSGHLLITGSSTMQPLIAEIATRFRTQHPAVTIEVQSGGSGRGVTDVRAHKADIGMASHAIDDQENLQIHAIARDGLALIVHSSNRVAALSNAQIVAIFTGKIRDWREVGGAPGAIRALSRGQGRGSIEVFLPHFKIKPEQLRASAEIGNNDELIAALLAHPLSIGFNSLCESERIARTGTAIRLLPIDGIAPSSQSIKTGDYPMTRPLTLLTAGTPKNLTQTFIAFAQSSKVTDLILKYDFVPYRD
jgi:phosphate transport system substrate-binding protein